VKMHVLFVHGAGEGAYEEDGKMAASLRDELGDAYDVRYPRMPGGDNPEHEAWKARISKELAGMDGEAILVGHSLGASTLLKYLSEEETANPVAGAFLIASPYWEVEDWEVREYALR
jgi:predicted alpha/beta hydrolase family esterase